MARNLKKGMTHMHRKFRLTLSLLGVFSFLTAGCGDYGGGSGIGPPSPGGFGNANVSPECGAFNQACLSSGLDTPLAVGSRLGVGISLEIPGNAGLPIALDSSNPEILSVDDGVATSHAPGLAAVLISGPDEEVIDFNHIWSVEPETLRIVSYTEDGVPLGPVRDVGTVLVQDELLVAVEAITTTQPLIGLFNAQWSVQVIEDPDNLEEPIISVLDDVVFGLYRIVARRPGTARLLVTALGQETELELEVLP